MTTRSRLWFKLLDMANTMDEDMIYPGILGVGVLIVVGAGVLSLFV